MTQLAICLILIIAIIIYVLIGWFIRALLQDEWEVPSLTLTLLWPPLILMLGLVKIFIWVEELAEKIKEKYNG